MKIIFPKLLECAVWDACANWVRWKEDYEYPTKEPWSSRPIFQSVSRFDSFCQEYSLTRTLWPNGNETADSARLKLTEVLRSASSAEIEELHKLRKFLETETKSFLRRCPGDSFCSKILCFRDPVRFPPIDTYNRKGLRLIQTGNLPNYPPNIKYSVFQRDFNEVLSQTAATIDQQISSISNGQFPIKKIRARSLDVYLMLVGGFGNHSDSIA